MYIFKGPLSQKLMNVQVFNKGVCTLRIFFRKLNKRTLHCTFIRDIRVNSGDFYSNAISKRYLKYKSISVLNEVFCIIFIIKGHKIEVVFVIHARTTLSKEFLLLSIPADNVYHVLTKSAE